MSAMTQPAAPPPSAASSPPVAAPPPDSSSRPPKQANPNVATIVVGLVILAVGIWYFLDTTLGLTMPRISWGDLWPVVLIVIGGVILFRAATDRAR
jgi:hypothetical protein